MVELDSDGWPVGEKRYNCDRCPNSKDGKPDGVKCKRKKRVGIGFCRDFPKDPLGDYPIDKDKATEKGEP